MVTDHRFCTLAKKRWNHLEALFPVILIISYRQSKLAGGTHTGSLSKETQQFFLCRIFARHLERWMKKEILMTDANHGYAKLKQGKRNTTQYLIEINHHLSPALLDMATNQEKTLEIRR